MNLLENLLTDFLVGKSLILHDGGNSIDLKVFDLVKGDNTFAKPFFINIDYHALLL